MPNTIKNIIENQEKFKNEIISFLKIEAKETRKILESINSSDYQINEYLESLKAKMKKTKNSSLLNLFVLNKNKNSKYYVFWDEKSQEAIIYKYDERKKKRISDHTA